MKAAIINSYGPASRLKIAKVPIPSPAAGQVSIEVKAASVNPLDWKIRNGNAAKIYGYDFPKILGFDMAGVIAELGEGVSEFTIGDKVYARGDVKNGGAYAEYNLARVETCGLKPKSISFEQAAAVPLCAITALQGLRDCGQIQESNHILITGAVGGVGAFAIQIAKILGAEVTAVCSTSKLSTAKKLGADHVIDYTTEPIFGGTTYDVIYDCVNCLNIKEAGEHLANHGAYMALTTHNELEIFQPGKSTRTNKGAYFVWCQANTEDLSWLANNIDNGKINIIIDSIYSLDDIQEAHLRSESLRATGKIIIKLQT